MLNNNFLPERTAPIRKQRDTQLNYPPLTNLINLLTANRKTSSFIYQDIRASLSLSLWSIQSSRIFFLINHLVFPYPKPLAKPRPQTSVVLARSDHPINDRPFLKNSVKKNGGDTSTRMRGWRIPYGGVPADFSHQDRAIPSPCGLRESREAWEGGDAALTR